MRLPPVIIVAAIFPLAYAFSQQPVSFTTSRTLVNVLSDDPDYSSLLQLLQRARLIPTLNRLNGSTFFAPTNDAIAHNQLLSSLLQEPASELADNIQEKLRQQLFYHLLNYSLQSLPSDEDLQVLQTLHYPRNDLPKQPPPNPWFPTPGGLLGGAPQRLRLTAHNETNWVGVDAFGKGGAQIIKGQVNASNGIVLGIDKVLEPPPVLAEVVAQHKSLSYFNKILTSEITSVLNSTSELTVFIPVDEAWEYLDSYERLYLESEFANDDLQRILNMHAVVTKDVKWSDTFGTGVNLSTIDGRQLEVVVSPKKTMVSTATLTHPDIYAANGVLHMISSLLIPDGALQITPEKYLLALNCTAFVSLIHSADLTSLINDTETKYTILAPSDDVMKIFGDEELPAPGSEESKRLLQYHFIPGIWSSKKLEDGMLLETSLSEEGLDGRPQVLAVQLDENEKSNNSVSFAGASVVGDPIKVHNTLIYLISRPLVPPSDALQTILPILDLSSFLAAIYSTSLADKLKITPSTSFLIPRNSAFHRLGLLVKEHFLATSSKNDLESVVLHHTLTSVEYARSLQNGLQNGSQHTFPTLEGTDIRLERGSNGSMLISASGGWAGMRAELYTKDILTETGVIHEVSDILIPRTVDLSIGKLVKAAKGSTMSTLVTKAGMEWVLNGTAPPEGSQWAEAGLKGAAWTLLCPTDDAFKPFNLTVLFGDRERLQDIISQHLIPVPPGKNLAEQFPLNNDRPLVMDKSVTYTTLRSPSSVYGDVVFRELDNDPGQYVIGIKGARGTDATEDWAKVLSWGRSTTGSGFGGVIQISRVLMPYEPPSWLEYGVPSVVGVLGVVVIGAFFYWINVLWRRDTTEATYEPVGGFDRTDEDDNPI